MNFFPLPVNLVRLRHELIENLFRHSNQTRVRNPGSVVASLRFPKLVQPNLFERRVVGFRIALDRNLCRHTTHRVNAPLVASLDQQIHI